MATIGDIMGAYLALPGLRGFWPFSSVDEDGKVYDMSEQGRQLTDNGTVTYGLNGAVPYAEFDGSTQWLSRTDQTGIGDEGVWTAGAWVYFDGVSADMGIMGQEAWGIWYAQSVDQTIKAWYYTGSDGYLTADALASPVAGQWYHVVGVWDYDNGGAKLYIDGVLQDTNTTGALLDASFDDFVIGMADSSGLGPFSAIYLDGRVSLAFYCEGELSAETIENLADLGASNDLIFAGLATQVGFNHLAPSLSIVAYVDNTAIGFNYIAPTITANTTTEAITSKVGFNYLAPTVQKALTVSAETGKIGFNYLAPTVGGAAIAGAVTGKIGFNYLAPTIALTVAIPSATVGFNDIIPTVQGNFSIAGLSAKVGFDFIDITLRVRKTATGETTQVGFDYLAPAVIANVSPAAETAQVGFNYLTSTITTASNIAADTTKIGFNWLVAVAQTGLVIDAETTKAGFNALAVVIVANVSPGGDVSAMIGLNAISPFAAIDLHAESDSAKIGFNDIIPTVAANVSSTGVLAAIGFNYFIPTVAANAAIVSASAKIGFNIVAVPEVNSTGVVSGETAKIGFNILAASLYYATALTLTLRERPIILEIEE